MIDTTKEKYSMEDLLELMRFLRSEKGCPWDREQTHRSLRKNVVEEAYEVVDAIEAGIPERLADELGDLLLQIVFHTQIADEENEYRFSDVADHLCKKLISRHTHLFGEVKDVAPSPENVAALWEKNKKKEKNQQKQTQAMKEIPRVLPALTRAYKIQKKARQVGFDWDDRKDVLAKLQEEIFEAEDAFEREKACGARDKESLRDHVETEVGDLLFAAVNYARFLDVEPEIALEKANRKFMRRFEFVEEKIFAEGKKMEHMTLAELDRYWDEAKAEEKNNAT